MERTRQVVAAGFGLGAGALLVLGLIDTLVRLPRATAPTTSLDGVYAALGRSHDLPFVVISPVVWAVFWAVVVAAALVVTLPLHRAALPLARRLGVLGTVEVAVLVLGGIGFFHWWSAFGMGMSVSDELPPGVGTTTPFGLAMVGGGLLCLVLAGVGALAWAVLRGRAAASRGPSASAR